MTIARFGLVMATVLVAAACSSGAGAPAKSASSGGPRADAAGASSEALHHFILRLPGGRGVDVLVGDRSITGPGVSLTRYTDPSDHAIRGQAFMRAINVDVTPDGAKGLDDARPFDIHVEVDAGITVREGHEIGHAVKARLISELPTIKDVLVHIEPA